MHGEIPGQRGHHHPHGLPHGQKHVFSAGGVPNALGMLAFRLFQEEAEVAGQTAGLKGRVGTQLPALQHEQRQEALTLLKYGVPQLHHPGAPLLQGQPAPCGEGVTSGLQSQLSLLPGGQGHLGHRFPVARTANLCRSPLAGDQFAVDVLEKVIGWKGIHKVAPLFLSCKCGSWKWPRPAPAFPVRSAPRRRRHSFPPPPPRCPRR